MRGQVSEQQCGLKEDEAGDPDGSLASEDGEELASGDRFHEEDQERGEEDQAREGGSQGAHLASGLL